MINIIQNTIGALARRLGIVKTNLQLWLGFTKADVLGAELVENGDFKDESFWVIAAGSPWSIDTASNVANVDSPSAGNVAGYLISPSETLVLGNLYRVGINANVTSGNLTITSAWGAGNSASINSSDNNTLVYYDIIAGTTTIAVYADTDAVGSVSIFSVKEVSQFAPDKSTNTNNAKLFTGKALACNGNDYVDFGSDVNSNGSVWTCSLWLSNYVSTSTSFIIGDDTRRNIGLNNGSGNVFYRSEDNTYNAFNYTGYNADVAEARRLVFSSNGTTISLYVDGDLIDTITPSSTNLKVSRLMAGHNTTSFMTNGTASDFQIYNAAWDEDDVAYDYANPNKLVFNNTASNIVVGDLVGYWALSEGSGNIAYDSSGLGNSGNVYDGSVLGATYVDQQPTIPQLGMMDWSNASGKTLIEAPNNIGYDILGNALRLREGGFNLDGSGYGSIASDATLTDITNGTIQFWLKTSTTKFSVLNGQSSSEYVGQTDNGVWTNGNSGTITAYKDGSTASTSPVYDGDWHFYTFTGVNLSTWTSFLISNLTAFELDCIVDEVLIYSDLLIAKEMDDNFNATKSKHSN